MATAPLSLSLSLDTLFSSSKRGTQTLTHSLPSHSSTFLDPTSLLRLQTLTSFSHTHRFPSGSNLHIRPMAPDEAFAASDILADSFSESNSPLMPAGYARLLAFLVRQYVSERRALAPHAVMLVGFFDGEMACTAEISFDVRGASAAPPSPLPPRDCPYVCNMTVKKSLRRRGIGWQLLKACEELICQMKTIRKVYLHCRVIDTVPYKMYKKAGYRTIKTDSILIWFTFQRRKHLMCKELPPSHELQLDTTEDDDRSFEDTMTEC